MVSLQRMPVASLSSLPRATYACSVLAKEGNAAAAYMCVWLPAQIAPHGPKKGYVGRGQMRYDVLHAVMLCTACSGTAA